MQRTLPEGIVIACDFCGTDWDEVIPMIEGHHGSVICLPCLEIAIKDIAPPEAEYHCTMCLMRFGITTPCWSPKDKPTAANPLATICRPCVRQGATAFDKDPDTDWKAPKKP
jgi:hypothetical protein